MKALLATARRRLYTAVLSDVLDGLGVRNRALPPHIRPVDDGLTLCGPARTALYREVYHVEPGHNPYTLEIALIDDLKPGDVAVMACNGSKRVAPWGELLSTASKARKAAGCLTDGLTRDIRFIRAMKFPVFAGGIGPLDSKGRGEVAAIDVPVEIAGVECNPGDIVFGDVDGVVIIPAKLAPQAIRLALEKVSSENTVRAELARGKKLKDVFAKHGIL